jgi:hypothetical protein
MHEVQWTAALYTDSRASDEQTAELMQIFSGQAGGHLAMVASHIEKVLGAEKVDISFEQNEKTFSLKIPDIADVEITAVAGQGGGDISISGHPLAIAPGKVATLARSSNLSYTDHGLSWSEAEKNGIFAEFSYSA